MAYLHHNTMRKYTAALLDIFNELEIQYTKSDNTVHSRNIPITFSSKEKSNVLDSVSTEQLLQGNYNVLPKAALVFSAMNKSDSRIQNKNNKINSYKTETSLEYMYNSVPYEFMFELVILCRGMNEATQVIEQICPKFNPSVNIDIWDAENLNEPTRIPVRLLDVSVDAQEYEELSSNLVEVSFGISLIGNLYPPIKSIDRIKEFNIYISDNKSDINSKTILGWDITEEGTIDETSSKHIISETMINTTPTVIDIVGINITLGEHELTVIYDNKGNKITDLNFQWSIISGNSEIIKEDLDKIVINFIEAGTHEIQVRITDTYGNYSDINKSFLI